MALRNATSGMFWRGGSGGVDGACGATTLIVDSKFTLVLRPLDQYWPLPGSASSPAERNKGRLSPSSMLADDAGPTSALWAQK